MNVPKGLFKEFNDNEIQQIPVRLGKTDRDGLDALKKLFNIKTANKLIIELIHGWIPLTKKLMETEKKLQEEKNRVYKLEQILSSLLVAEEEKAKAIKEFKDYLIIKNKKKEY